MTEVLRSRALWGAIGSITLAVVLLITFAPARDVTHTVLGWLRVTPLEIEGDPQTGADSGQPVPVTPTPTLADAIEVIRVEPSSTIGEAMPTDIDDVPFQVIQVAPPDAFAAEPRRSVTTFGTVTLGVDTADLAALLAPGFQSRRLARRLGTDQVTVAGGALVMSSWPADDAETEELTLIQIEAPLVSGLPPRDLELLAELMSQAFIPPILSRELDVLEIPLVQLALGLEVEDAARPTEPTLTDLPGGHPAVTWLQGRSQLVLTGPLSGEDLLRLAATARGVR